ncbi:hypothetical protein RRG08_023950 [Elysia crispata]|uniref:Uncharacterized protein n=1 Tax=Elysia crispata TaxID=231223 RepID=A0AAE0YM86_9GAST|nr:hypothetical protein RRG08_023950 [Elysia crispata]
MEFPRRNSPFISRLELLEGRFFSPASHAQHITSLYDSNPRLDDSLQELTLVKDSSEPSPSSSSCEKPDDLQEEVNSSLELKVATDLRYDRPGIPHNKPSIS